MNEILESLSVMIKDSFWLAPLLALLAGLLTSVTPCSLSTIPLVIGVVGGTGQKDTKRAFRLSLTFAIGTAITEGKLLFKTTLAEPPERNCFLGFGKTAFKI